MKRYTGSVLTLLLMTVLFAGCEGESVDFPTRPQPGTPTTPAGQVELTLTASTTNPLPNSISIITATVRVGGQTAPNGTAVEFTTNFGTFTENNAQSLVQVTNGGVASATLTATTAGTATVNARVGEAFRSITIRFGGGTDPGGPGGPIINAINPTSGPPAGGTVVTITGLNFLDPVRVLFGGVPATVVSRTDTQIRVSTPAINLGASEQRREVDVVVITQAGTPNERQTTSGQRFAYELVILTPSIIDISPSSGPNEGNTRITIFGEGFQPPTKVFFGTGGEQVEVDVQQVFFDRIIAMTPPAHGLGAGLKDQSVTVRVLNVNTNREATKGNAFRYGPGIFITNISPLSGSSLGGTRLVIDGWGFDDPVSVTVAGVSAQPVHVSGTQIIAVTGPLAAACESAEGAVVVRNIEDGAVATADQQFNFVGTLPTIISVSPNPATPGLTITVVVRNAGPGTIRFRIAGSTVLPVPPDATDPNGDSSFDLVVPSNITFNTAPCIDAAGRPGVRNVPTVLDINFDNVTTGCSDTLSGGLTVNPTDLSCQVPPDAVLNPATAAFTGTCGGPSNIVTISVSNIGGSNLNITGITSSHSGFTVLSPPSPPFPTTVAPGAPPAQYQVQINPLPAATGTPPVPPAPVSGTITVSTNDPTPPPNITTTVSCTFP